MEISLKNRIALVTGSAQGIGEGIALVLARAGADVVVCDIEEEMGLATVAAVRELGVRGLYVNADISDPDAVKGMMRLIAEFGGLDIIVNNAAVEYFRSIEETTLEEWDRTQSVDLKGIFLTTKFGLPMLKAAKSPIIINISSVHATATIPDLGAYAAAKGGIVAMTHSMAQDLGRDGIRVLTVSPGFVYAGMTKVWLDSQEDRPETLDRVNGMHPGGRIGTPEDIGNLVAFLCTDLGGFINGVNVIIDGGLTTMLHH